MEAIFDLPAHVLFVHFPVVMTPLAALAAIVVAVLPSARRKAGLVVLGWMVVVFVSILLAMSSGEGFDELLQESAPIDDHESLAETTRLFVLALVLSLVGLVVPARTSKETPRWLTTGFAALTIVFAVLSAVWVIRTGHEGARVTWTGIVPPSS